MSQVETVEINGFVYCRADNSNNPSCVNCVAYWQPHLCTALIRHAITCGNQVWAVEAKEVV